MKKTFTVVLAILAVFLLASCAPTLDRSNDKSPDWVVGVWQGEGTYVSGPHSSERTINRTFKSGATAQEMIGIDFSNDELTNVKFNSLATKDTYTATMKGTQNSPDGKVDGVMTMTLKKIDDKHMDYKFEIKSHIGSETFTSVESGKLTKIK